MLIALLAFSLFLSASSMINNPFGRQAFENNEDKPSFKLPKFSPSPANCELCTLLVGTGMTYTDLHHLKIDDFIMNKLCPMFPATYQAACNILVKTYGPIIIHSLIQSASADQACRSLNLCDQPQCTLFPKGHHQQPRLSEDWDKYFQIYSQEETQTINDPFDITQASIAHLLKEFSSAEIDSLLVTLRNFETTKEYKPSDLIGTILKKSFTDHSAAIDRDGDSFSKDTATLRGYHWRGRDCDDSNANIYPGRKQDPTYGKGVDYNCNGISGFDPKTNSPYKDVLCGNSKPMGVVVMGDSAGAHAEVPRGWVDATMWNSTLFKQIPDVIADEVDLPHFSAYTGYFDQGYTGPVSSVYKKLYERNKCNFRDYQNIAVNGANSRNSYPNIVKLARKSDNDYPLLMFLELVGNDVCNHRQSFDPMTTPAAFRANIIKLLDYLDSVVPAGSHLVALGVANGSKIYQALENKMHPVGVSYPQLYDYQNCLGSSFCWGWLNTNQTVRDLTTQRANELNDVYRELVTSYKPKNFDFVYYDFPVERIWNQWVAEGNDPYDLFEPADGFHPSQIFNAKLGDYLWQTLMTDHPDWLGDENPNNDLITQLFGDQGGY